MALALLLRPVMLSENVLAANLAALQGVQNPTPALGPLDPSKARVQLAADGSASVERIDDSGQWIDEDQGAWDLPTPLPGQLVLIGTGLGEIVERCLTANTASKVIAIEPDAGVATLMLAARDWRPWLQSGRLRLLTGPDYRGASAVSRVVSDATPPQICCNPIAASRRPFELDPARRVASRIVADAGANTGARRRFAGRYLLQTLRNLPVIQREADAAVLRGSFGGRPAVVVGAGPSLDENMPALERFQDRAVIIAADTALRPLVRSGVRPHLLVGVDPGEMNARHLSGVDEVDDIFLAAEASLHPIAWPAFAGRTFHFNVGTHEPWPWLAAQGITRATQRAWGSVVTSAFDLALGMGCNPIVFAGLDLAFTDGRPYARGTLYYELWQSYVDRGCTWDVLMDQYFSSQPDLRLADVHGRETRSAPQLRAFRDWLRDAAAAAAGTTIVNATGAGILHGPQIEQYSLTEILAGTPSIADEARRALAIQHQAGKSSAPLRKAIDDVLAGRSRGTLERWRAFALDTITVDEILSALTDVVSSVDQQA